MNDRNHAVIKDLKVRNDGAVKGGFGSIGKALSGVVKAGITSG